MAFSLLLLMLTPFNDFNALFSNIIFLIVSPLIAYRRTARRSLAVLKSLSQSTSDAGIARNSRAASAIQLY